MERLVQLHAGVHEALNPNDRRGVPEIMRRNFGDAFVLERRKRLWGHVARSDVYEVTQRAQGERMALGRGEQKGVIYVRPVLAHVRVDCDRQDLRNGQLTNGMPVLQRWLSGPSVDVLIGRTDIKPMTHLAQAGIELLLQGIYLT